MRYFTYSPLDMNVYDALERALPYLDPRLIVQVTSEGVNLIDVLPGSRPRAFPNTYLVRVEQDNFPRVVDSNLE